MTSRPFYTFTYMGNFKEQLMWLSFEDQMELIQNSEYITTIVENGTAYKSDLYLVENKYYVEAVYDLSECPDELAMLCLVEKERLVPFLDSIELQTLF